ILLHSSTKFARLFVESEYDTVEKIAGSDYEELYLNLVLVNEERGEFKEKFGKDDIKLLVRDAAPDVPRVIQWC
ncbi:hypothetical protein KFU94_50510, partial [Chloroflexi bacterium TSY]|nr:hypothetical protein [Chloroflexi bacterium TSY]